MRLLGSRSGSFFSLSLSWARSIDRCQICSIGRTTGTGAVCTGIHTAHGSSEGEIGGVGAGNLGIGMGELLFAEEDPGSLERQSRGDFGRFGSLRWL